MNSIDEAKKEINELIGRPRFEIMVELTAILTSLTEVLGLKPIIVGGLAVEIPDDHLANADVEKVTKIQLRNGKHVYVIGIEDIILDRLRACVHWKSRSDCEWGYRLFQTHFPDLDLEYMKNMAKNDRTDHLLKRWLDESEPDESENDKNPEKK